VGLSRVLRIRFATPEAFSKEYTENLSKGGVFVTTDEPCEMREHVQVVLALGFCAEKLALAGEVVHRVTADMASVGATVGVAVQFDGSTHAVRKMLEPLRQAAGASEPREHDPGRRRSPRMAARAVARIDGGDGAPIAGHTRDVSQTGVLVAVKNRGVPIGERVNVELKNPTSGESMSVAGVVAREVETEGGLTALGIEFSPGEQDREAVADFVDGLQHTEHARRLGGIRGDVEEVGIPHVLQMFGTSARRGTLSVRRNQEEALVGFDGGRLRYVQLGGATGMKALVRLLSWTEGAFEFHSQLDPVEELDAPLPLEVALLEGTRLLDESRRVDRRRFPQTATPRIASEPAGEELSKVEVAVLDLARVGFPVARILEVIPEPDPEILHALETLSDRGILSIS